MLSDVIVALRTVRGGPLHMPCPHMSTGDVNASALGVELGIIGAW